MKGIIYCNKTLQTKKKNLNGSKLYTVPFTNIGTLDKYEQRRLWK